MDVYRLLIPKMWILIAKVVKEIVILNMEENEEGEEEGFCWSDMNTVSFHSTQTGFTSINV